MNIVETIKLNLDKLTKSEHTVAAYFLENQNQFAFETLDSIAEKIKTSTTSVLRFCRKNGFDGYKAFQEEVRSNFNYQFTLPDKFKITSSSEFLQSHISKYAVNAVACIESTFNCISESDIYLAAEKIINANRVFCFGLKESFSLAHYAYTRFLTLRNNVFILSAGQSGEIESLLSLDEGDVCVFYLFHRYTKQSPQILKELKKRNVTTILITSPPYDQVESDASILFPCFVDINGIKNSYVAPACLTDCLCNSVVSKSGAKTLEYMKESECLFESFTF